MSERFTPGPWEVESGGGSTCLIWVDGPGTNICDMYHKNERMEFVLKKNAEANAYLIGAAPDLFEACVDALDQLALLGKYNPLCQRLAEAIEKARGGKPYEPS